MTSVLPTTPSEAPRASFPELFNPGIYDCPAGRWRRSGRLKSLAVFLVALSAGPSASRAAISVTPSTIRTGLRWDNVSGGLHPYAGTRLTVSGAAGPLTWTIEDQNGTAVAKLAGIGGTTAAGMFGQIDCTGSADNAHCVYSAPSEYPPGESATLTARDGTNSASVSVVFVFAYNLQEYWKHRARMLGFNAKPVSSLVTGANPVRYQPELFIFRPAASLAGQAALEDQIVQTDNDVTGAEFPVTAGSGINRPSWTYDGKWFSWGGTRCSPRAWCSSGDDSKWIARSDGSELQRITLVPGGFSYTYDEAQPDWLLTSDASHLYVIRLDLGSTRESVATYSGPVPRKLYSQTTGSTALFKEPNPPSCAPVSALCSPNVYLYDFSPCETSLGPNCARLASKWNLNLRLNFGWDAYGKPHCSGEGGEFNCERHAHDLYLRRNTTDVIWNYGPAGDPGESLFYQTSAQGTGTKALYPNAENDVPYFSHPAFDGSGDRIAYGGQQSCKPSGHTCTSETWGEGIWDLRANKAVAFSTGASYGHGAWDGFDEEHFAHDGYGGSCPSGHWCLQSSTIDYTAGAIADATAIDFGARDRNSGGEASFGLLFGPSQSPDGTKIAETMKTSFSAANQWLGWISVVHSPSPPVNVKLASAASATLEWTAAELNHEAAQYIVYKQAGCAGPWARLARVAASYLQRNPYHYLDGQFPPGQTACYGVTTVEWSGLESSNLSRLVRVTNNSGVLSASPGPDAGRGGFDTTSPHSPSAFSARPVPIALPAIPRDLTQGTGGSLTDGVYWVRVAYCNFSDFPANLPANAQCTPPGPAASVRISNGNGRASIVVSTSIDDMNGQLAVRIYAGGPARSEPAETLQTCLGRSATYALPWPPNGWPSQVNCTLAAIAPGAGPATDNRTLAGYRLRWNASADSDLRYYAIYSRDGAAPALAGADPYAAQTWLIATVPAGVTTYLDYTVDWARAYTRRDGPYYGIVAVDRQGNRSAPVCLRAETGAAIPCS